MMKKLPGLKSGSDAQTHRSFGERSRRAVFCSLGAAALLVLPGGAFAQGVTGASPAVGAPADRVEAVFGVRLHAGRLPVSGARFLVPLGPPDPQGS